MGDGVQVQARPARAADLRLLAGIEDAGLALFVEALGEDGVGPALRAPAPSGAERAAAPGSLVVAAPVPGGPVVGFAHVLHLEGHAHLEQLSVLPSHQRRGIGSALVRAAAADARRDGHDALSLCTYRDLAFNGPFYARLGFAVVPEAGLLPFQRRLREHEVALGLDRSGARVVMHLPLRRAVSGSAGRDVTGE